MYLIYFIDYNNQVSKSLRLIMFKNQEKDVKAETLSGQFHVFAFNRHIRKLS